MSGGRAGEPGTKPCLGGQHVPDLPRLTRVGPETPASPCRNRSRMWRSSAGPSTTPSSVSACAPPILRQASTPSWIRTGAVEAARGDLPAPLEAELWELLRQRLPHEPFRIAVAHQEPWRNTGEEGGEIGVPERVEKWNPQRAVRSRRTPRARTRPSDCRGRRVDGARLCARYRSNICSGVPRSGAIHDGVVCAKRDRSRRARTPGAVRSRMRLASFAEDRPESVGPDEVAGDRASRIRVRALHARPEPVHRGEVEPLQRKPRVVHSRLEPLVASVAREDSLATLLRGIPGQERIGRIPEVHHRRGT